jgi:NTP pyrophosphatase (non-canonical NTP hydrolase)
VGEVGELAEKLKKHLRGGGDLRDLVGDEGVLKETGDAGWYYARIAKHFGFKLSAVFRANKDKLLSRLARGVLHGEGDNR